MNITLIDLLWSKTTIDDKTGCWVYQTGSKNGSIRYNGTTWQLNRLSLCIYLKLKYKDISWKACHVDELCSNRKCWNPIHHYAGTTSSNALDSIKKGTHFNNNKALCSKGHLYDRFYSSGRSCSICQNELRRKRS